MSAAAKPAPGRKPRQRRSPEEKAQEAYDVATRKVQHVDEQIAAHRKALRELEAERTPLVAHRDYLAQNPYLPKQPEPPSDAES